MGGGRVLPITAPPSCRTRQACECVSIASSYCLLATAAMARAAGAHGALPRMNYVDLVRTVTDSDTAVAWLRQQSLLADHHVCVCGRPCCEVRRPGYPEGRAWRCPRKGCQKVRSLRHVRIVCFLTSHLQLLI